MAEFEFMRTTLAPRPDAEMFLPDAHGSREYVPVRLGMPPEHMVGTGCRELSRTTRVGMAADARAPVLIPPISVYHVRPLLNASARNSIDSLLSD